MSEIYGGVLAKMNNFGLGCNTLKHKVCILINSSATRGNPPPQAPAPLMIKDKENYRSQFWLFMKNLLRQSVCGCNYWHVKPSFYQTRSIATELQVLENLQVSYLCLRFEHLHKPLRHISDKEKSSSKSSNSVQQQLLFPDHFPCQQGHNLNAT